MSNRWMVCLPLCVLLGACLLHSVRVPLSDYAAYYFGGKLLLKGHYAQAYDLQFLNFYIAGQGYKGVFVSYAPFPPFTSLVTAPFAWLPVEWSKLAFNIVSCVLFVWAVSRVRQVWAVPLIFFVPIVNNLLFGQWYLVLCFLLLEGYRAHAAGRHWLSSLLWGVAILCKVFPGVIFLYLLIRKEYKAFVWLALACALLFGVSLAADGWASWRYYLLQVFPRVNNGELNDSFTYVFQSAFMLAKRAFVYDGLLNPHPVAALPWVFTVVIGIFKAVVVGVCAVMTYRRRAEDFFVFGMWIAASVLVSPNGSSYSLILLLVPLSGRFSWVAAGLLLAACSVPVQQLGHFPQPAQFPRLYLLLALFGLWWWREGRPWNTWVVLGLAAIFCAAGYPRPKAPGAYLLSRERHVFIYRFDARNGFLVYDYWDGSGRGVAETAYPVRSMTPLTLRDNQIFCNGRKQTNSPDGKAEPMLVNGNTIVYLSDANRGIGFYTLRTLIPAGTPTGPGATPPALQ